MDNKPMHIAFGPERAEVWLNRPTKKQPVAIFFDPGCADNARLFLRAQHVDELVEAAQSLADSVGQYYMDFGDTWCKLRPADLEKLAEQLRAVLAKIRGGQ